MTAIARFHFLDLTVLPRAMHAARPVDFSSSNGQPAVDFTALVREHRPALDSAAARLCRSKADAGDLVQDALERALRGLKTYDRGRPAKTWLLAILKNVFIDRCRRGTREGTHEELDEAHAVVDPIPVGDPRPAWARVSEEQFHAAVKELPPEFRVVYRLNAIDGKSYAEIAQLLGIPKATVGTRLLRARSKLLKILQPEAPEEDCP